MNNVAQQYHEAFVRHALQSGIEKDASQHKRKLSGIQEYAVTLYRRGFNVFPVPSAHDWNARGEGKKPYILEPLFRNRMHYREGCTCPTCQRHNFVELFEGSNLAIMCGTTSGNLLSIDCDTKAAYDFIGGELERRGLVFPKVWTFTSGRGGGHYLLRVLEGEAADIPQNQSKFDDVQVWASRHFVIVPPSVHPNGTLYQWRTPEPLLMLPHETLPAVSVNALDWLGVRLKTFSKSNEDDLNGLPEYAKNLSHASRDTLKHGAKQGGRNSALWNLACDLVGIGLSRGEVEDALTLAANNCQPPYPSDTKDAPIKTIVRYAFSKERKPSRKYQKRIHGAVQDWQRAQAFALTYDWHGNFGAVAHYARRVYMACIERARLDARSSVFRAAVREVARHAGMNKDTAAKYMRLLAGRNYDSKGRPLFKCAPAEPLLKWQGEEASGAYVFSFVFGGDGAGSSAKSVQYPLTDILLSELCTTENRTPAAQNRTPATDAEADAFHGLGAYAFAVWRELCSRPAASLYDIAKRLAISRHTAKDTVTRLAAAGLVTYSRAEGLYIGEPMTDAQLAIIAANRGTAGKAAERRERDTLEREKHVNRLVYKAKRRYYEKALR
jgi:DNA-binding transcriptional regulator YhcF (GntR family)